MGTPCRNDGRKVSSETKEKEGHCAKGYAYDNKRSSATEAGLGVVGHDTCIVISLTAIVAGDVLGNTNDGLHDKPSQGSSNENKRH